LRKQRGGLILYRTFIQPETATHHYSSFSGKFIMQTQYVLKQAGLTLPVTKLFQQHIATLLAEQSQQTSVRAVVINFRDPDYSAESGDFIRLKCVSSVRITNGISIMSQTLVIWGESTRSWKRK
jgi:hypothetical protein